MRRLLAVVIALLVATTAAATERGLLVEVRTAPVDSAWWEHLDFVPRDTQVRGIAVNRIDPSWCKASELTEAAFPDSVRYGERGLEANLGAGQNGFSAKGSFEGRPLEIVLGIFESCGGESGNFVLVLAAGRPASSPGRIVQVERISARPVLMFLSIDPARGAIYMPSCFQCDHENKWQWDAKASRFMEQPEPDFGDIRGSGDDTFLSTETMFADKPTHTM